MPEIDLDKVILRPLRRNELDIAVQWAADEGWNPGLKDAEVFWNTDPEGFLAAEHDGELVATGSIVSYGGQYGFMGLFIVRPDLRGQGIGTKLWFHRRDVLKSRMDATAAIGMDGVFDMQPWYAKGGFIFTHRNLRMEGVAEESATCDEVRTPTADLFEQIQSYDTLCFGCNRESFLHQWLSMPNGHPLTYIQNEKILGYGVIRKCQQGYKIGPLFADNTQVAKALFDGLSNHAVGEEIWLDIPENNVNAVALAEMQGMKEVFGCARMYYGSPPPMPWEKIYGISTFELG